MCTSNLRDKEAERGRILGVHSPPSQEVPCLVRHLVLKSKAYTNMEDTDVPNVTH